MIGNAVLLRGRTAKGKNLNLTMLAKIGFDFQKNGFQLFRKDGHEGSLIFKLKESFLPFSLKMGSRHGGIDEISLIIPSSN